MDSEAVEAGYQKPVHEKQWEEIIIAEGSDRLQLLDPFQEWDGNDLLGLASADQSKREMYYRSYFDGRVLAEIQGSS